MRTAENIILLGDVCLTHYDKIIAQATIDSIFDGVKRIADDSLVFGNLECVFPDKHAKPNLNKISLAAPEKLFKELLLFDGVCLSNNHIEDLGIESVTYTRKLLAQAGIKNFGYGDDIKHARTPFLFKLADKTVAILSYSCLTTNGENYAGHSRPGVVALASEYVEEDYAKAKAAGAELVIVSIHWGIENTHYPTKDQIAVAHRIIDCGVDFIWGNHAHAIQGMELYKGKWIAYGLGNFLFSEMPIEFGSAEGIRQATLKQHNLNLESIGIKLGINPKTNLFEIKKKYYFSLKKDFLPILVEAREQTINLSDLNNYISEYIKNNPSELECCLNIRQRFNGNAYQNVYENPVI